MIPTESGCRRNPTTRRRCPLYGLLSDRSM
jgi:hypothetical protein